LLVNLSVSNAEYMASNDNDSPNELEWICKAARLA
jgi:hypothetical protein